MSNTAKVTFHQGETVAQAVESCAYAQVLPVSLCLGNLYIDILLNCEHTVKFKIDAEVVSYIKGRKYCHSHDSSIKFVFTTPFNTTQ